MHRPDLIPEARILVIDDQPANVALLEDLLEQAGYTAVEGVTDPRLAAPTFHEFGPDLVLLDLVMPHLDGFGVMAQLRPQIADGAFLPILERDGGLPQRPRSCPSALYMATTFCGGTSGWMLCT